MPRHIVVVVFLNLMWSSAFSSLSSLDQVTDGAGFPVYRPWSAKLSPTRTTTLSRKSSSIVGGSKMGKIKKITS